MTVMGFAGSASMVSGVFTTVIEPGVFDWHDRACCAFGQLGECGWHTRLRSIVPEIEEP